VNLRTGRMHHTSRSTTARGRRPLRLAMRCLGGLTALLSLFQATTCGAQAIGNGYEQEKWQYGVFLSGGFAPAYEVRSIFTYQEELRFYTVGIEIGKRLTSPHGRGALKGNLEGVIEVVPLWEFNEPRQVDLVDLTGYPQSSGTATFPGYKEYGAAVTPILLRWNFSGAYGRHATLWVQGGAGLLWTSQDFPQGDALPGGHTSRLNFTPQMGVGEAIRVRNKSSIDVGAKYFPITNAGLGQTNPGVSLLQFSIGYSWHR
jgi:hypothetical protein